MPDSEDKKPATRDPRALSTEYHKARKQLMLWAAILFIWELVGIDLEKMKEAGGNAGAIITAIKSPQAVPWALLILVGYFAVKLRIEWRQCNEARRQVREAKQDYYLACGVALAAFVLYFGQAISHIQFANAFQGGSIRGNSIAIGFGGGVGLAISITILRRRATGKKRWKPSDFVYLGITPAIALLTFLSRQQLRWIIVLPSLVPSLVIILVLEWKWPSESDESDS